MKSPTTDTCTGDRQVVGMKSPAAGSGNFGLRGRSNIASGVGAGFDNNHRHETEFAATHIG